VTIDWDVVERIADDAARRSGEIEDAGELPADLLDAVLGAGLLRLGLPAHLGGHDLDPLEWFRVVRRVAEGDGSTGWLVAAATSFHDIVAAGADPVLQDRFFGDRRAHLAGGVNGDGVARRTRDGMEVSGRWGFASGCRSATWLGGLCLEDVGAATAAPPSFRWVMVPADRAEICPSWDVTGLRGTGSHTVVLPPQTVPEAWTFPFPFPLDHPVTAARPHGIAARGLWPTAVALAGTQLGIARRGMDEVATFARGKHRRGAPAPLIDEQIFARRLTQAEAAWRAAVRGLESVLVELAASARAGDALGVRARIEVRLLATHAAQTGSSIVRECAELAGAGAIARSHPIARCLRDGALLSHHAVVGEHTYEALGRVGLGLVDDSPFV
jgi:alkylation response protein AidB-like acyl-CoA dehydrogenase